MSRYTDKTIDKFIGSGALSDVERAILNTEARLRHLRNSAKIIRTKIECGEPGHAMAENQASNAVFKPLPEVWACFRNEMLTLGGNERRSLTGLNWFVGSYRCQMPSERPCRSREKGSPPPNPFYRFQSCRNAIHKNRRKLTSRTSSKATIFTS